MGCNALTSSKHKSRHWLKPFGLIVVLWSGAWSSTLSMISLSSVKTLTVNLPKTELLKLCVYINFIPSLMPKMPTQRVAGCTLRTLSPGPSLAYPDMVSGLLKSTWRLIVIFIFPCVVSSISNLYLRLPFFTCTM